jgi:cyanophycin synthetase
VGDGAATIRQLVEAENQERLRADPIRAFTCFSLDLDSKFRLEDNGVAPNLVPPAGQPMIVKNVANQNADRDNVTVRDEVHPYFHDFGRQISSLLGVKLIGADIMSADISVPLDQNGGVINELNVPPGLHYHELIANTNDKTDVAAQILGYVFGDQSRHQ